VSTYFSAKASTVPDEFQNKMGDYYVAVDNDGYLEVMGTSQSKDKSISREDGGDS